MRWLMLICAAFFIVFLGCRTPSDSSIKDDDELAQNSDRPPLYSNDSTLKFALKAPFHELMNSGQPVPLFNTEPISVDGELILGSRIIKVRISNRGRTSKQECKFFKLRVSIQDDEAAEDTPFSSPGSFKLGTHCDKRNENAARLGDERAVNRERALYRIYEELSSDKGYRSRTAVINYKSTDSTLDITKQAFVFERFRHFRNRNHIDENLAFELATVSPVVVALNHLFQIYALNTDWQIERLNMFERIPDNLILTTGTFNYRTGSSANESFIVPYDFDIAGMVNGRTYWEQNSDHFMSTLIDSAKTQADFLFHAVRLHDSTVFGEAVQRFKDLRSNILEIISQGNLDPEGKQFFEQRTQAFFGLLDGEIWNKIPYVPAGTKLFKDEALQEPLCSGLSKIQSIAITQRRQGVVQAEVPRFIDVPVGSCGGIFSLEPGTLFWVAEDKISE